MSSSPRGKKYSSMADRAATDEESLSSFHHGN
jgi:hypothetical protein